MHSIDHVIYYKSGDTDVVGNNNIIKVKSGAQITNTQLLGNNNENEMLQKQYFQRSIYLHDKVYAIALFVSMCL